MKDANQLCGWRQIKIVVYGALSWCRLELVLAIIIFHRYFNSCAGDVAALGSAIPKACTALKDAGGAADEYHDTIRALQRLESIFAEFGSMNLVGDDKRVCSLAQAVKSQAVELHSVIDKFTIRTMTKFDATLGTPAVNGAHRGTWDKIDFASRYSKQELSQFKNAVAERSMIVEMLHSQFVG